MNKLISYFRGLSLSDINKEYTKTNDFIVMGTAVVVLTVAVPVMVAVQKFDWHPFGITF